MTNRFSVPKPNNLLYIGLLLMIVKVLLSMSNILPYSDTVDTILSFGSAAVLAVHIILKKLSAKQLILYAIITVVAMYSVIVTGQYGFLITAIAILAISGHDMDRIIYFIYKWELLFFVAHTFLAFVWALFPEHSIKQVISGVERYNFGFGHPNTFSVYLFNLIIMWVWINYEKIKDKNVLVILLIGCISFAFTRTRTILIDIVVLCALLLITKRFKYRRTLSVVAQILVPCASLLIFFMITQYTHGNAFVLAVDALLSGRIKLGAYAYYHYGLSFFGQPVETGAVTWDPYWRLNGFTFDCTYSSLMVMQGIIWLIILSIGFWMLGVKRDNRISIAVILWGLYAVTEVHGLNGFLCFPILLLALLLGPAAGRARVNNIRQTKTNGDG